ncbi:MAG: metallopeptidase family protein [Phycisphaeraceae bacterium]|nr:metallopeptidase family protein [Phycisphaeraceae bacterium]
MRLSDEERQRFDALLDEVVEQLPARLRKLLEEKPLVVDDAPSRRLLRELGMDPDEEDLCGLHTGIPLTERSVQDDVEVPEHICIFRRGVIDQAGGWEPWVDEDGTPLGGQELVRREIRITLLHEIGHHFGLDEEDLEQLGYG